ncbi:MAG: SGNH/GDSL hydrolase family protein [Candidatus Magasanikbacteria bacterium]|nr:SGNH/GDSL hydrolase family protein [Candidatus Magasanikbacteria bacterium]
MTEAKKNILTLVIALLLSLIGIEFFLRMFDPTDFDMLTRINEDGFVTHKTNVDRGRYDGEVKRKVHVKTNSLGFVGEEFIKEKNEGALRVAVLGDSFAQGIQIDYEKTYVYLLKNNLQSSLASNPSSSYKSAEVLNFGIGGMGTADEMKYYSKYASQYHPDVVVLSFYLGNDISDNGYYFEDREKLLSSSTADWDAVPQYGAVKGKDFLALKDKIYRKLAIVRFMDKAVRTLPVLNNLAVTLGLFRPPVPVDEAGLNLPHWDYYYLDPLDSERAKHAAFSSELINNFRNELEKDGVKLIVMLIPEGKTVNQDLLNAFKNNHPKLKDYVFNPVGMENKLIEGLNPGAAVLNLRGSLERQVLNHNEMYNSGIHHFSEKGHIVVSEELAKFIVSLP